MEPDWVEDTLIDFNSSTRFYCERGMKFRQDFSLASQEAICRPGNTWEEPSAWLDCIESTFMVYGFREEAGWRISPLLRDLSHFQSSVNP